MLPTALEPDVDYEVRDLDTDEQVAIATGAELLAGGLPAPAAAVTSVWWWLRALR